MRKGLVLGFVAMLMVFSSVTHADNIEVTSDGNYVYEYVYSIGSMGGQSFISKGDLVDQISVTLEEYVDHSSQARNDVIVKLTIYEGEGFEGKELGTATAAAGNDGIWTRFDLGGVVVSSGSSYTFKLELQTSGEVMLYYIPSDAYAQGHKYLKNGSTESSNDLGFKVYFVAGGQDGMNCIVEETEMGAMILCEDGTEAFIRDGVDGQDGQDGKGCTLIDNMDGTSNFYCEDGSEFTLSNGQDGQDGQDGTSCTVEEDLLGQITIKCSDGSEVTIDFETPEVNCALGGVPGKPQGHSMPWSVGILLSLFALAFLRRQRN